MSKYGRRAAGTPLTEDQMSELRALAEMPDSQIDFFDIPERIAGPDQQLPLELHTLTLQVDAEVAAWLENVAVQDATRINWLLKRESRRRTLTATYSAH